MVGSPGVLKVRVKTPKLVTDFAVRRTATGGQLFGTVVDILELEEHWFFGLQFVDQTGKTVWLEPEERLTSRAAHDKNALSHFTFCVRFWPQEAAWTLSDVATELLFLQLRSAVLDDAVSFCPASTAIELAAYALQARCGDFKDPRLERGQLTRNRHLPRKLEGLLRSATEQWQERAAERHRQLRGLPRREAMHEYLHRAQQLPDYGATFFNIRCEYPLVGSSAGSRSRWFWMSVTPSGVIVSEDKLTHLLRIPWEQLRSVRYYRCKFSMKLQDRKKFWFFTRSLKQIPDGVQSKELLTTITGQMNAISQQRKKNGGDELPMTEVSSCCREEDEAALAEGGACFGNCLRDEAETESPPAWMEPLIATGWIQSVQLGRSREPAARLDPAFQTASEASLLSRLATQSVESGLASWSGSTADVLAPADDVDEPPAGDTVRKRCSTLSRDSGVFRVSVSSDDVFK